MSLKNKELIEKNQYELTFEVERSVFDAAVEKVYRRQAKNITIQTKKVVENYYRGVTGGSAGGTYSDHFKSWENNEVGYFKITVSCAELNLQQVFSFRITSSISGVGLNQSTITF